MSSSMFCGGGAGVVSIDADTGSAGPSGGVITIAGGDNIATTGAGSTITISLDGLTDNAVLVGNGTSAITSLGVGTNGQILTGSTGADPVFAAPTSADNSIRFTVGAGSLDLSATGTVAISAQTATSYQLVLADAGKLITCNNAAAITLTIPPNSTEAFDTGTTIIVSQLGAGAVTATAGAGVTLVSNGAFLTSAGQYALFSLIKIATDTWLVSGDVA